MTCFAHLQLCIFTLVSHRVAFHAHSWNWSIFVFFWSLLQPPYKPTFFLVTNHSDFNRLSREQCNISALHFHAVLVRSPGYAESHTSAPVRLNLWGNMSPYITNTYQYLLGFIQQLPAFCEQSEGMKVNTAFKFAEARILRNMHSFQTVLWRA